MTYSSNGSETYFPYIKAREIFAPPEGYKHVSVVVPVKNEAGNIEILCGEIRDALEKCRAIGVETSEIIFVNDGSTDRTGQILTRLETEIENLKALRHKTSCGQSAALRTGVIYAQGEIIVTLDGDGQNDPADIPALIAPFFQEGASENLGLRAGQRKSRQDSASKRRASSWANAIRKRVLKDETDDTGCGLKAFRREGFLLLPYFDHIHRYLPALFKRDGWHISLCDVRHRPRQAGRSNYGNLGRLIAALSDLPGVLWLLNRRKLSPIILEKQQ